MDDDDNEEIIDEEELIADYLFSDPFGVPMSSDESNAPIDTDMSDAGDRASTETNFDFTPEQLKLLNEFSSEHAKVCKHIVYILYFINVIDL